MIRVLLFLYFLIMGLMMHNYARAESGSIALYDYAQNEYLNEYNVNEVRSIASITKLFTAITVLRSGADLDEKIKIAGKSSSHFANGTVMTRRNVMHAMLTSSDNRSAETLANTYPGGFDKFIFDVNEYAQTHGLINTHLVDATGLLAGNVSTAEDLLRFLSLIAENATIRELANDRTVDIEIDRGRKHMKIHLHNTNPSIYKFDNILISKTGFTNSAGRCVLMLVEKSQRFYGVVVLGQQTVKQRSKIANDLIVSAL